ncbi:MAG: hypothetical protein U9Q85_01155, partial [Patescibacteria group bacterium]|nr:hypothetical protein [Patescibacteria group bacterium]
NNEFGESLDEIKERISQLNLLLKNNTGLLIISHTFFLKLFLIFKKEPLLFNSPEIIKKYINPKEKIIEFGEVIGL